MSTILLGILFITLYLLWREYQSRTRRYRELGNQIPGPKPLPLIGNTPLFGLSAKAILGFLNQLNKEYGPVVRGWIGPQLGILLADPVYVELLLGNNKNMEKSSLYKFAGPLLQQGLVVTSGEIWKKHRKIIAPPLQGRILETFVEVFNSNLEVLIEKLSKHKNGPEFDVFPYVNLFTLDVICETAMGVKLNAQLNSESDFVKALQCLEEVAVRRGTVPWLYPDVLFKLSPLGHLERKYLPVVANVSKRVIQERKQLRSGDTDGKYEPEGDTGIMNSKTLLDYLLDHTEAGARLTNQEFEDEVNTILLAGHDTTACGISFTCWLLAKHPHIQEKAFQELKTIFGDSLRHCTPQDLTEMHYLEQVIKESLRILPPTPIIGRKLTEDIKSDKYILPAGCEVGINVYMLHRHPEYFPNPERFDPDRFLPENSVNRHPYCYIPFGGGLRNCVGYKYAMQEMKTALATILRHFKILPPQNPFQELELTFNIVVKPVNGVCIRLEPRGSSNSN